MATLQIEHLVRRFGQAAPALDGLSLSVAEQEFVFLLGPSGAGKTTTLRLTAGLDQPDSGRILLGGRDMAGIAPRDRNVAMVYDKNSLYPHLNVFENMAYPLRLRRMTDSDIRSRIGRTAEILGIGHLLDRRPGQLSGGQQQRVAIGRALVRDASIYLMDEPISHLDAKLRAHMRVEFKKLQREFAATILYVSHDQLEAMTMGDRIVVIDKGRVQQVGTPRQIFDTPANRFVAEFVGEPAMNTLDCALVQDGGDWRAEAPGVSLHLNAGWVTRHGLQNRRAGGVVLGMRPQHLTLAAPGDAGQPNVETGRVYAVETLGSETVYDVESGGRILRIWSRRAPDGRALPAIGAPISFRVDPGALHLFDSGTGQALAHPDPGPRRAA
ncbi:ABC transporter ATP-binding protein [Neotabrizicola sp. VNH66]|uniref:ABC transporter ATP-binding protein n=1 Tax=Neotabrizicola sp. VNH66 TaxID=3400918 RepID=UPI003C0A062F